MDGIAIFKLVASIDRALPFAIVLSMSAAPFPRHRGMRAIVAIIVAWIASILFVGAIYNPAGIAAGHALGEHFPENRYDNNTIASTLIGGWLMPALCVGMLAAARCAAAAFIDAGTCLIKAEPRPAEAGRDAASDIKRPASATSSARRTDCSRPRS